MAQRSEAQGRAARRTVENVITGLAHAGVCVPDCEAAVAFYRDVLGLRVLSPPYVMSGNAIRDDMGELVSDPTMKAAIVGFGDDSDRVLEVDLDKPGFAGSQRPLAQHRKAANSIGRTEMKMNRQPVAQRRSGEPRGVQQ